MSFPLFAPLRLADCRAAAATREGAVALLGEVHRRIEARGSDAVWIHRPPLDELIASLPQDTTLPLYGIPFALKDNIDVRGWPTTAGCPAFAKTAERDARVIQLLRAAGAIPVGKTNLDQFATGLVGTRSPYGIPHSVFSEDHLAGGSSSGSAVAVAAGLVAFSLGTDTAGSGRVPAAFNNLVGLKPTRGLISTRGVVPACRSLDCVSIFAHSAEEAEHILAIAAGADPEDPYTRSGTAPRGKIAQLGVPRAEELATLLDPESRALFATAVNRCRELGCTIVEIDIAPFLEAARLLYAGPWVAERLAAIEPFLRSQPEALFPITRQIIEGGARYSAVDAFRGQYELERLRGMAAREWQRMDALLLPTTPSHPTIAETVAEPLRKNSELGIFTNFVNLLDLCGIAIPAGFRGSGLPFGITILAPAFHDLAACALGRRFLGEPPAPEVASGFVELAVVGAHLSGQPLNGQLTERGATLVRTTHTTGEYRLWALSGTVPPKPGLIREPGLSAPPIEVEVWRLTAAAFGDFVAAVPPPMVIGTIALAGGVLCKGFLCEPYAVAGGEEITHHGGWRAWLASRAGGSSATVR